MLEWMRGTARAPWTEKNGSFGTRFVCEGPGAVLLGPAVQKALVAPADSSFGEHKVPRPFLGRRSTPIEKNALVFAFFFSRIVT